jgi:hypothetical protein
VLEGVSELQIFGFDIDASALKIGVQPGSTEFHGAVLLGDFVETRRAGEFPAGFRASGPDNGGAGIDLGQGDVEKGLQIFRSGDAAARPAPDAGLESDARKFRQMIEGERFEEHSVALEYYGRRVDRTRIRWRMGHAGILFDSCVVGRRSIIQRNRGEGVARERRI